MALTPASSRPTAFDGGTITDPLDINTHDATTPALIIHGQDDAQFVILSVLSEATPLLGLDQDGEMNLYPNAGGVQGFSVDNVTGGPGFGLLRVTLDGNHVFRVDADGETMFATSNAAIDSAGRFSSLANTAPSDGSLSAGEFALWFDPSNGAAKLMIKAKQADGTVKTGSVNVTT